MLNFFSDPIPFGHPDTEHEDFTRWSIFLIVAECVGLPALVWALTVLHHHHKHKGRVSGFIVLLLLCDLTELLLNTYIATQLIKKNFCWFQNMTCHTLLSLRSYLRHFGVCLQQLMVLENVWTLVPPNSCAHVFYPPFSIIFSTTAFVCFILFDFFHTYMFLLGLFPLIAVTVTSWTLTCRTPPLKNPSSNEPKKQDWTVLVYATITVTLYLMSLTLYSVVHIWTLFIMNECLLSLRVAIDPLLCVLVCRQEQTHTSSDLSTEHTAVQAEDCVISVYS